MEESNIKVAIINSVQYGSTGRISNQIAKLLINEGNTAILFVPKGRHNKIPVKNVTLFGSRISEDLHILLSRITGFNGCFSVISTISLLNRIDKYDPDIIHLHNLHNSYINLPLLFSYLKKHNKPVVWTLHDCWAFTGQCPHFLMTKCNKWVDGCYDCPSYKDYPQSYVDMTRIMWRLKKRWFTNIKKLTIVTPSVWLSDLVKKSYLQKYPVKVIHNGIDLDVFFPRSSEFKKKYGIDEKKYIILGVAFGWGEKKGLDVMVELSKKLDKSRFQIVLVGTDAVLDSELPKEIISIHRTENRDQLAEIYSVADVFVNPTREDTYPTVNMESIACGTPVITFDIGGSPEIINKNTGEVVKENDIDTLISRIKNICETEAYASTDWCTETRAFDNNDRLREYVKLYEDLTCGTKCSI